MITISCNCNGDFPPEDSVMLQNIKGNRIHATIRNRGLTDRQVSQILKYLKGKVSSWCRNHPSEEFSVSRLFGSDWRGTPIQALYKNRRKLNSSDPVGSAGKDCGFLLRRMLQEDSRTFRQTSTTRPGRGYKLVKNKQRR